MKRYEYMTVYNDGVHLVEELNMLGAHGWKAVMPISRDYVLMRRKVKDIHVPSDDMNPSLLTEQRPPDTQQ